MKHFWVTVALLACAASALADDFPTGPGISDEELQKGFGADSGMTAADSAALDKDRVQLGGQFWSEFDFAHLSTPTQTGSYLFNPNTLWVYLDGKLKNDVRAFVMFRAIYDPTADSSTISPFTGQKSQQIRSILDELKLQFQLSHKVFFTVGRQKLRWGTGKVWNPTDVLNNQRFDFRFGANVRPGVALAKMHVPIGSSNLYLIELLEGANRPRLLQHALRAEIPIKTAEFSPGVLFGAQKKPIFTLDGSSAVWDLDVYGEIAYSQGARQTFYDLLGAYQDPDREWTSWVAGASYDIKYSDSDALTLGLEYFRNGLGYGSTSEYLPVFLSGGYVPFYLAEEYGMFMIGLPSPGNWDHTSFNLFNIVNLSDHSALSRVDMTTSVLQGMSVTFALGLHYGNDDGELRLGGQRVDGTVRLMANF